jgi:RNA polymerase sigma-70 factor (ECF subfamily)
MDEPTADRHLSHISTLWSLVYRAHLGRPEDIGAAQQALLERYAGAVRRYLLGALRDPEAADELFQEFSLLFLRGDFRGADPARGRFRNFVKTAVFHLIVDYQRRRRGPAATPAPLRTEPAVEPPSQPDAERAFVESWRQQLIERTWQGLRELEQATGQPHHTVLRFRTDNPVLSSADLAAQLGPQLGKAFTVSGVRQALHRARERFTELLLDEVVQSLENSSPEELEQELIDLRLLTYCQSALARRGHY